MQANDLGGDIPAKDSFNVNLIHSFASSLPSIARGWSGWLFSRFPAFMHAKTYSAVPSPFL